MYEIRDPIYGFISINELEREIINHPTFQRLRRIHQLGLTDMVYPGSTHSRFEHSLGVMHFATLMFEALISKDNYKKKIKNELKYNNDDFLRDRQLIRLSALLHDIGQPPFSHSSEDLFPKNPKTKKHYNHEDYSCAIIKEVIKDVIENSKFNEYKIKANEVSALIEGNHEILGKRVFWKNLISGQIDADRGDYLLRDSHHIGVKYGVYDYSRLINTLSVGFEPEEKELVLCIDEDGKYVAESLVIARYLMFTQVYFHKTRRAYDFHIQEAMKYILNNENFPTPKKINDFLTLNDSTIYAKIFESRNKNENCKAIVERNHIRLVYSSKIQTDESEKMFGNKKSELRSCNIWFYEDKVSKTWYKINLGEEEERELLIKNDNEELNPLSKISKIAKNIGEIKEKRLYVWPKDKDKAEEVLK